MELNPFFKSIIDQDNTAIVICDTNHVILYMNPTAIERYKNYGGSWLMGKSLLSCHNSDSVLRIKQVVEWFGKSQNNKKAHTFFNEKENKDVYIIALRDDAGNLIGYYEKHEYRDRDLSPFYDLGE